MACLEPGCLPVQAAAPEGDSSPLPVHSRHHPHNLGCLVPSDPVSCRKGSQGPVCLQHGAQCLRGSIGAQQRLPPPRRLRSSMTRPGRACIQRPAVQGSSALRRRRWTWWESASNSRASGCYMFAEECRSGQVNQRSYWAE